MSGFGNLQPRTGNKDSVRLEEVIVFHKWPADEWSQVRFLPGKILPVKRHWINIMAGGKGKEKKAITIPRYCIAFDVNNENEPRKQPHPKKEGKFIPIVCPYCTLTHGNDEQARYEFFYLANAIIREVQEDMPARAKKIEKTKEEKKTGFKDIRSKAWTPVQVCRITSTVAGRIKELGDGNFVKDKKSGKKVAYDVTHEKYGIDIRVKYKPKGAGSDKYSADKDDRTPLSDDEKAYLIWRLDDSLIDATGRTDQKQAEEDFKRMDIVGGDAASDDDEDGYSLGDDDDDKKSKKSKKKSSKSAFADDDDDDEDEDDRKKSKKSSKSKKSKSRDDDDDEDEDEDDEDDKKSSKKSSKKPKKKGKPAFSDDDDDDDEDEDEDEKPKKSKKSSKSDKSDKVKKSSKDDKKSKKDDGKKKKSKKDEDEPKKKKKTDKSDKKSSKSDKASSKKSSSKKKKAADWDDDDE